MNDAAGKELAENAADENPAPLAPDVGRDTPVRQLFDRINTEIVKSSSVRTSSYWVRWSRYSRLATC